MQRLWLVAFAILIAGCETAPPQFNYTFTEFEPIREKVTYPEELPNLPRLVCHAEGNDECKIAGYTDSHSIDVFETYIIRAEANTEIAQANAEALEAVLHQSAELVSAGKAQENITAIREEQLQFERRQRVIDRWYYRAMLVLIGAAGLYAAD